jgi:hypothetical protein
VKSVPLVALGSDSPHWRVRRGPGCVLLVFVDDATGRLMQFRFVQSKSTFDYINDRDTSERRRLADR